MIKAWNSSKSDGITNIEGYEIQNNYDSVFVC